MKPTLWISPDVWAKLIYLMSISDTEVSGFGVCEDPDYPLWVTDFKLLPQSCTAATTDITDEGVADYFLDRAAEGLQPNQFGRIWIHTHPQGCAARPSSTDNTTFKEALGECDWAVMVIINEEEKVYAELQLRTPIEINLEMEVKVDFASEFDGSDFNAWEQEFKKNVTQKTWTQPAPQAKTAYTKNFYGYGEPAYAQEEIEEERLYMAYMQGGLTEEEYDAAITALYLG